MEGLSFVESYPFPRQVAPVVVKYSRSDAGARLVARGLDASGLEGLGWGWW